MNWFARLWTWSVTAVVSVALVGPVALAAEAEEDGPYRKLAPGVMIGVYAGEMPEATFSRHDIVELTTLDANFDWAKNLAFRHDVWSLEMKFKPMRMIDVDIPQADGNMRRTRLWYMVYNVTNLGHAIHPVENEDDTFSLDFVDIPVRFIPEFRLETTEFPKEKPFPKVYPDQVIPIAMGPIRHREDPNRKFLNTIEIAQTIEVDQTLWGVATWESLDPRIDRFSVYVNGLTNAYEWADIPDYYKEGDPLGRGRKFRRKTLKLNFWRPGDEYDENEKEFRFGIPGAVDYEWIYR